MDWIATMQAQEETIVERLRWLIEHETPTDDKAAVDRLGRELAELGASLGGAVTRLPQTDYGDLVRLDWAGTRPGQVLVLTHIDTVWPLGTLQTMPYRLADGRVHGPGSLDMKAGVAMVLTALDALRAAGRAPGRRLVWLITSEEEIGSPVSRPVLEEVARASDYVLVLEPGQGPAGALKTARKGVGLFTLTITGRAAHAGVDPGRGVSAIEELAHQVLRLHQLTDLAAGTTVNVGLVRGGTRRNVVAAEATAEIDVRVATTAEAERIVPLIRGLTPVLPGARLAVSGGINRPPMERTAAVAELFGRAQRVAAAFGIELGEASVGGASDGNFAAACGATVLDGLGVEGDGAHAAHEHIYADALARRGAYLAALVASL